MSIKTLKEYSKNTLMSTFRATIKEKRKPVIIVKLDETSFIHAKALSSCILAHKGD